MPYGTVKVDNVTFTNNSVDATTTFSGIYASITNNLTLSGTATAATFTGTTANFTNVNAQNISVTTSLSGLAITGGTAGFTTITGTTVTGTTANFATLSGTTVTGTTANFVTVSGTTVTGNTGQFTNLAGAAAGFTTVTGTTITGTTANFVSGVFTTRILGTTVTGTTASFTSGVFTSLSGTTHTITSGVFASGTAALPSISFVSDPNTGIYSPGADQLAVATNGTRRLLIDSAGALTLDTGDATIYGVRVGRGAGASASNTAVGSGALAANTTGTNNFANGYQALYLNTTGAFNTAIGTSTLSNNTTADSNTAVGQGALYSNTGAQNTALGRSTLGNNTTGSNNTAIGNDALVINTTGGSNCCLGYYSGSAITTGSNNTIIGSIAGTAALANTVIIAAGATERLRIDSSGNVGIGNSSPQSVLDIGGVYQAVRTHLSSLTDTFHQYRGTPDGTGFEHARVFSGRDTSVHTYGAYLAFYTEGKASGTTDTSVERLRIDSSGRVGIGTTTVNNGVLHVKSNGIGSQAGLAVEASANDSFLSITNSGSAHKLEASYNSTGSYQPISFVINGEKARIDTSGRLLVGTSTAREVGVVGGDEAPLQIETPSGLICGLTLIQNRADHIGPNLRFGKTGGATVGSVTTVSDGDELGTIQFCGADGTDLTSVGALIRAQVDGTPGNDDMPGRLVFSTTADGAASPTEAMRINSQQELLVGTATRNANGGVLQLKSGITFPATAVAASDANTLDDYEEGTWTPVVTGWTSVTYTFQEGKYIKIGKHLTAWFLIQFSGTSAATAVTITGLPFTGETSSHGGSLTYYNAPLNETSGALIYPDAGTISFYADSDAASVLQSNGNASGAYLVGSINSIRS
jgi:hypothetical protein